MPPRRRLRLRLDRLMVVLPLTLHKPASHPHTLAEFALSSRPSVINLPMVRYLVNITVEAWFINKAMARCHMPATILTLHMDKATNNVSPYAISLHWVDIKEMPLTSWRQHY